MVRQKWTVLGSCLKRLAGRIILKGVEHVDTFGRFFQVPPSEDVGNFATPCVSDQMWMSEMMILVEPKQGPYYHRRPQREVINCQAVVMRGG